MCLAPVLIGILTALTQPSPAALRTAIRETRALTANAFGVNMTLLPSINPPDYDGYARAAVEEGVRIFETAGNNRECQDGGWRHGAQVVYRCGGLQRGRS